MRPQCLSLILLGIFCLALAGCGGGTKVTAQNYEKIKIGMPLADVEAILGPAGEDATDGVFLLVQEKNNLPESTKWKKWQAPGKEIRMIGVAIVDGKVVSKSSMGL